MSGSDDYISRLPDSGFGPNAGGLPVIPGGWMSREVVIGSQTFSLALPADPNEFLSDPETLASRPDDDDYAPYWPHLWTSARPMAEAIASANWTDATRTLELGCGVGLVGLAGLASGLDVTFSDYEPHAVQLAHHNAHANGFDKAGALVLDWREPISERFPVILACDVVYDVSDHLPLLDLLAVMLEERGCCWIGDAGRQTAASFIELARRRNFDVELHDEYGNRMLEPHVGRFQLMQLRAGR
ncbi:MAG: methyltransferase domain-containing protein [Planctomycetaceae bacterium]|nr:methyltransferase domain-containing protein [Planctomycetaceae bacterium]MBT6157434.1 methyltransferase domain-containing protein [Planctomycetaceae bacterium]MBT6486851.1 methyltransferase domain-containing protein [Planctomycetaceae bacterium]MBT6496059.1 methyltransferase domain-containing protein [Planctomycetaceae bacterium]